MNEEPDLKFILMDPVKFWPCPDGQQNGGPMKLSHFSVLFFLAGACASPGAKLETQPKGPLLETPSISLGPATSKHLRTTELKMKSPRDEDVASVRMEETSQGILVLFETEKLTPGSYQVRIEDENCDRKTKLKAYSKKDQLIKEFRIRGTSYSDEFKMTGYHFEEGSGSNLNNKSFKIYHVGDKSSLRPAACGTLSL